MAASTAETNGSAPAPAETIPAAEAPRALAPAAPAGAAVVDAPASARSEAEPQRLRYVRQAER